jgi:hypothetical protein
MAFQKGDRVKHPVMPDWGIGQVLETSEGININVYFAEVGEKTLSQNYVDLLKVKKEPHLILDNLPANKATDGKKKRASKKPRVPKTPGEPRKPRAKKAGFVPIIEKH